VSAAFTVAVLIVTRVPAAQAAGEGTGEVDRAKFSALYQAATAVEAATRDSDLTRSLMSSLVDTLEKQVLLAKPQAKTPVEVQMVGFYAEGLEAYRDGLQFWRLRRFANQQGSSASLDALAVKYGIQSVTIHSYLATWQSYPDAVFTIWHVGNVATAKGTALFGE
jgi:hypothetical protein